MDSQSFHDSLNNITGQIYTRGYNDGRTFLASLVIDGPSKGKELAHLERIDLVKRSRVKYRLHLTFNDPSLSRAAAHERIAAYIASDDWRDDTFQTRLQTKSTERWPGPNHNTLEPIYNEPDKICPNCQMEYPYKVFAIVPTLGLVCAVCQMKYYEGKKSESSHDEPPVEQPID